MGNFLDVNCWLALTFEGHLHHREIKQRELELRADGLVFSRFTQMGLLRLLTTPEAMSGAAMTMKEAWKTYDRIFTDEGVSIHEEPGGIEVPWRQFAALDSISPKVWGDS